MNRYQKISLIILIGSPLLFLIISIITGIWDIFLWSLSTIAIALTIWKAGSTSKH
ncbi:hypothetical protein [Filobacillus milosensis]|uniref:hypothetical protein n=1 Tax=Filobacillus milosensis TaxID=94137 RepID=UPI001891CF42|nr:hypothetical protein [Filobacillus milosensis]